MSPPADLKDPLLESIPPALSLTDGPSGIVASFRAAIAGVLRTIAAQRNMKFHVLSAMMVLIIGMALPLAPSTRVALLFAIAIVFFAEILNTALEAFVDLHVRDYHRLAMMAKDAAAAGVLVLAATTVAVLAEVLWSEWHVVTANMVAVHRSLLFGVPLVFCEALGLFAVRRGVLAVLRLLASCALLLPLVRESVDPIYATLSLTLVLVAAYARWSFPRMAGRGAPRTAST